MAYRFGVAAHGCGKSDAGFYHGEVLLGRTRNGAAYGRREAATKGPRITRKGPTDRVVRATPERRAKPELLG